LNILNNRIVSDIPLVPNLIQISTTSELGDAFQLLIDNNIQAAPVYKPDSMEYIGFIDIRDLVSFVVFVYDKQHITDDSSLRDLVHHGKGQIKSYGTDGVTVSYLARRNLFLPVTPSDSLISVLEKLCRRGIHRVPVVENGVLVNVITQATIMAIIADFDLGADNFHLSQIPDLGTHEILTVYASTKLIDAFKLMDSHNISGVAIIDDNDTLLGVTTGKDLKLFLVNPTLRAFEMPIFENLKLIKQQEIDIRSVTISVRECDSLDRVIKTLAATKVHRIFVVDEETSLKPVRVISITDVINYLLQ